MTSETKIAANRTNAKKSTGPTTTRGKSRASGNAWRHGWAVVKKNGSTLPADVERVAAAICSHDSTAALYEQAVIIAECEIFLLKLRAARVAVIQRHSMIGSAAGRADQPLRFPAPEKGNSASVELALGEPRADSYLFMQMADAVRDLKAKLAEAECKGLAPATSDQSPVLPLTGGNGAQGTGGYQPALPPCGDVQAFQRALAGLVALDRYERRAVSRRNRAIRMFQAISSVAPFLNRGIKGR